MKKLALFMCLCTGISLRAMDAKSVEGISEKLALCLVCKEASTQRCSKCKTAKYCSRTCQTVDWPKHKVSCKAAVKTEHLVMQPSGLKLVEEELNDAGQLGRPSRSSTSFIDVLKDDFKIDFIPAEHQIRSEGVGSAVEHTLAQKPVELTSDQTSQAVRAFGSVKVENGILYTPAGLSKEEVLWALYEQAGPVGESSLDPRVKTSITSLQEAHKVYKEHVTDNFLINFTPKPNTFADYVRGRYIKVEFKNFPQVDVSRYDTQYGPGAARRAIEKYIILKDQNQK